MKVQVREILKWSEILCQIHLFYKQLVYKQLALGWQIAKDFSGFKSLSLSNNKSYKLKKNGVFALK